MLFCLLYKHQTPLQATLKATLLRNENLPFIHQPNKVARKAGDVQQRIGDTNQHILYDKHLISVIFPLALQFSQIFIFHFHRDNVSKNNNGELFFTVNNSRQFCTKYFCSQKRKCSVKFSGALDLIPIQSVFE